MISPEPPSGRPAADWNPDRLPPDVRGGRPTLWSNPRHRAAKTALDRLTLGHREVRDAESRWARFGPLLSRLFPETAPAGGRIDSRLIHLPAAFQRKLLGSGRNPVLVKADHDLPVTGCIKARGGVYEVLSHAEELALAAGLVEPDGDYARLANDEARRLFGGHSIVVGSTGNLGFSVGVIARALGFKAEVHMSSDAKSWKKDRLRALAVKVVEHEGDYTTAVAAARAAAARDAKAYFIDDENSLRLFLGYAVAAADLARQLAADDIPVDADHPLILYLPCGVGGAPGGITLGLKLIFGDAAVCLMVEPVRSPCMLVQLAAGPARSVSVYDAGLDNRTDADGLAVAAASMLVARMIGELVDGCITVEDRSLYDWASHAWHEAGLRLEPSAAAGFAAAAVLADAAKAGARSPVIEAARKPGATHLIWTTGGQLLPQQEFDRVLAQARAPVDATP
ncbi:MAG TPA: D-serine ammonia-lyase [Hypericibacter adhaerens]|uniref:D-serine ammonia-lyase n=1 Tax=Hypericibacter adhaerens TaxID=2602016 RepID=UPI002C19C0DF|nr:D-serine ammonia-lyase [Hypericibacter adhaerens]HWA45409.1 D-serine ammonia-lyase [Hypericibacter adhaerens]